MDEATLQLLRSSDHPEACEYPPDFLWEQEVAQVRALRPRLESIVGRSLTMDEGVQDAAFFTDLSALERHPAPDMPCLYVAVGIRFSAFGRLATVWSSSQTEAPPSSVVSGIAAELQSHGYRFVSLDALEEPYTGTNRHLQSLASWWRRFFDYF